MATIKERLKTGVGIMAVFIAVAFGKAVSDTLLKKPQNHKKTETYHVNLDATEHTITTKNTNVAIKTTDKMTGTTANYNVNLGGSVQKIQSLALNASPEQKEYQTQNKKLILEAIKAYSFIMANDYKVVKYCSQYHPVTNVKKKYDIRFKEKKNKAEYILNKAFGPSGANDIINAFISNPDIEKTFYAQVENDYQQFKSMLLQEGVANFTRQQYCEFTDEEADSFVETTYKDFKTILPNF